MTPEGKVKAAVRKRLEHYGLVALTQIDKAPGTGVEGFFFMPVAGPYSVHGIHDFVGCWRGRFFSIETKAPDNKEDATSAQLDFQRAATLAGGVSLVGVRDASIVDRLAEIIYRNEP